MEEGIDIADKIYGELKSKPIEILAVLLGLASTALITYNTIVAIQERKKRAELEDIQKEMTILQYQKLKQELGNNQ
jgi:hypothetical protein